MSKLAKYLNEHIVGNVFDRQSICHAYSTDGSMLQATPRLVALPETTEDLRHLVRFSNQLATHDYQLPLTIRGTGIDKTGAAIGDGLVISTERMNHIEEIDIRGRLVRVQPGITLEQLNSALSLQGLCLPLEYDPRATIGGLIANCPTDDAANQHGGIFSFVERVEVVLSNGDIAQLAPYNLRIANMKMQQDSFEGALYRRIDDILNQHADLILDRSMRPFNPAGYANITRVKEPHSMNLLPLMFASQGTLALVSDIILRVEVLPPPEQYLAVVIHDIKPLLPFLETVEALSPHTIRLYDLDIVREAESYGNYCNFLPLDDGHGGWLAMISFNNRRHKSAKKVQACLASIPVGAFALPGDDSEIQMNVRELQSALYSYINNNPDGERLAVVDDVYIPKPQIENYLAGLKMIEQTLDLKLSVFGSYLTSNYQVRPCVDYTSVDDRKKVITFLRQYSKLIADCQGSITGGSPEGRVKALSVLQSLPPEEQALYRDIKNAFDPHGILNPRVKLGADLIDTVRHMRTTEVPGITSP